MAAFFDRWVSLVAYDEDAGGRFDDVVCNGFQLVDFQDAGDLGEQSLEEPEVASGYPFDCCDGLGVGKVLGVQCLSEAFKLAVQDEEEFLAAEGPVSVGEAKAAIELRVVAKALRRMTCGGRQTMRPCSRFRCLFGGSLV